MMKKTTTQVIWSLKWSLQVKVTVRKYSLIHKFKLLQRNLLTKKLCSHHALGFINKCMARLLRPGLPNYCHASSSLSFGFWFGGSEVASDSPVCCLLRCGQRFEQQCHQFLLSQSCVNAAVSAELWGSCCFLTSQSIWMLWAVGCGLGSQWSQICTGLSQEKPVPQRSPCQWGVLVHRCDLSLA